MPDDLLRHLIDAPSPTFGWVWLAAAVVGLLGIWYAALLWWTSPRRASGEPALVTTARSALSRRRALNAIESTRKRYRVGDLDPASAAAELSGHVRRFLRESTGQRTEYLQVSEHVGVLAPAAPVLTDLADVQFNRTTTVDVDHAADSAETLVRQWT